jgi:glutaredoxin-related protein
VKEDGRGCTIKTSGVRISVVCNFFIQMLSMRSFRSFIYLRDSRKDDTKESDETYPPEIHSRSKGYYNIPMFILGE